MPLQAHRRRSLASASLLLLLLSVACQRRPAPRAATVAQPQTGAALVPRGALWRYLDTGVDAGTAWRAPGFDDAAWKEGRAPLGYGDGDEATVISAGSDINNKHLTSYFRHAFTLTNPDPRGKLALHLLRDDGAIVYLNGTEVMRSNMPAISDYRSGASNLVGNADEKKYFEIEISASLLARGKNVMAVEVHQLSVTSSDVSFDLELARAPAPAR